MGNKLKTLRAITREQVSLHGERLVRCHYQNDAQTLPPILTPAFDGVDLIAWAKINRENIEELLLKHGSVLFRGFTVKEASRFEQFIGAVSTQPMEYRERSSPRSQVVGNIYTSTDHPSDQAIFLHNEQSYNLTFPLRIFFFCLTPARQGGETPIADCRKIFNRINPQIRELLMERKYLYVRNFGQGFGLSWQSAFQTTSKSIVEEYCREHDIEFEWKDDDRLTTRQVRQMAAAHPRTKEMIWFNHATFFHVSTLAPDLQRMLTNAFRQNDFPNNTYYGDGSMIEPEVLHHLRDVYQREMVTFPWQAGDILMLDNMLSAHGRAPFSGPRRVVVGMSERCGWNEL
jgi:alpha-ketoglutarate-dependent taurine dioxygenase